VQSSLTDDGVGSDFCVTSALQMCFWLIPVNQPFSPSFCWQLLKVVVLPDCHVVAAPLPMDAFRSTFFPRQDYDYARFDKDRMLTSFGHIAALQQHQHHYRRIGSPRSNHCCSPDEEEHSIRGIEHLCDQGLGGMHVEERKDLYRAVAAEEARQREDRTFPDLDGFSKVSLRHTGNATERALILAHRDARYVEQERQKQDARNNDSRSSGGGRRRRDDLQRATSTSTIMNPFSRRPSSSPGLVRQERRQSFG
jgi:hypothetical protein